MTTLPKISVITVSYNQGEFIRQNIESVLAQNYPNFEHIVVDGGSTDETVEVLKSHPHLLWTSEPDRGQTHALNKGFAKATGDIIAWLNSDDWYAPGVFAEVAQVLESSPIVMGACEKTNKEGQSTEKIDNIERNWFDIIKYWVFNAVPDQPAIFFKKSALDSVKKPDGTWLDEDLEFCMDLDLWLRLSEKYSFDTRIPRTLAYYRVYEENKTGRDMAGAYREMSRLFKRHGNNRTSVERGLSFILLVDSVDERLERTLRSIEEQSLKSHETVVAYTGTDDALSRKIKRQVLDLGDLLPASRVRFLRLREKSRFAALNKAISTCGGELFALIQPGVIVEDQFELRAHNLFSDDAVGIAFTNVGAQDLSSQLFRQVEGRWFFNAEGVLTAPVIPDIFVARKLAFIEIEGFKNPMLSSLATREFVLRLLRKGWQLRIDHSLGLDRFSITTGDQEVLAAFHDFFTTKLVCEAEDEDLKDPFAAVRKKHRFTILFPDDLVQSCRRVVSSLPPNWEDLYSETNKAKLINATTTYPDFAPFWILRAKMHEHLGELQEAQICREKYRKQSR